MSNRQNRRTYYTPEDNGGALIGPMRAVTHAYQIEPEMGRKAVRYVRRHAHDAELLIEILGLTDHDS